MLVILVRTIRPYTPLLFAAWVIARVLVPSAQDWSLWEGLFLILAYLKHLSLEVASQSQWAFGYVPFVKFTWVALEDFLALSAVLLLWRKVHILRQIPLSQWQTVMTDTIFHWTLNHVPLVEPKLDAMAAHMMKEQDFEKSLNKSPDRILHTQIPKQGWGPDAALAAITPFSKDENQHYKRGKISGTVYHGDAAHTDLMNQTFAAYTWGNPLHLGIWPRLVQCGAEVIAMTGNILHAPQPVAGTMTSGGTESILCAIRASLNHYGKRRGIQHPELICGTTAHAAVDKACELMGIRKICIDCTKEDGYTLNPAKVRAAVTSNTILIYASAPCYPQGVIDPIEALSQIALSYDIGLHVDACLGGFVLAFWEDAPKFDFTVPGVTSMSIDTHKFGYCAKGTSVVVYRNKKLRHAQYFCYAKWTGGIYATPSFAGTRPGALEACAWTSIMSMGQDGYKERVHEIVQATQAIATAIDETDGVELLTKNPSMVVCFGSDEMDITKIGKRMKKRGWELNTLQNPLSMHICVTALVAPKANVFIDEFKQSVDEERLESNGTGKKGSAGIYGSDGGIPEGPINHVLNFCMDAVLAP
ncbi:Sphingosine-1-phosphate lyase [Seminavis robusta]|uniref:sphinganine-1-phosphate aldolase n=1 Tax=Seminavis robusta TaxID=568900 RepID=A0A9N8HG71_9STRA|nr:Sphingosine-1-phosphate lyase [Seminavis robusta]|eukprot:Sro616_g176000.1 Sphingosine-1-phosphate lyase (587) ;mRNA; f:36673-38433